MSDDQEHIRKALILAGLVNPGELVSASDMEFGELHLAYLRTPHALAQHILASMRWPIRPPHLDDQAYQQALQDGQSDLARLSPKI